MQYRIIRVGYRTGWRERVALSPVFPTSAWKGKKMCHALHGRRKRGGECFRSDPSDEFVVGRIWEKHESSRILSGERFVAWNSARWWRCSAPEYTVSVRCTSSPMIGMECYQYYGALPLPAKNNLNGLENSGRPTFCGLRTARFIPAVIVRFAQIFFAATTSPPRWPAATRSRPAKHRWECAFSAGSAPF